jgi:hypothetical protein
MGLARSVFAVLAGYLVMAALSLAFGVALTALWPGAVSAPGAEPGPLLLALNVAAGFVFAVAGGHACARIARRSEMLHAGILAGLVCAMGLALLTLPPPRPGVALTLAQMIAGVAGILFGGYIREAARAS